MNWLLKSANNGNISAMIDLALLWKSKCKVLALEWYLKYLEEAKLYNNNLDRNLHFHLHHQEFFRDVCYELLDNILHSNQHSKISINI